MNVIQKTEDIHDAGTSNIHQQFSCFQSAESSNGHASQVGLKSF